MPALANAPFRDDYQACAFVTGPEVSVNEALSRAETPKAMLREPRERSKPS